MEEEEEEEEEVGGGASALLLLGEGWYSRALRMVCVYVCECVRVWYVRFSRLVKVVEKGELTERWRTAGV